MLMDSYQSDLYTVVSSRLPLHDRIKSLDIQCYSSDSISRVTSVDIEIVFKTLIPLQLEEEVESDALTRLTSGSMIEILVMESIIDTQQRHMITLPIDGLAIDVAITEPVKTRQSTPSAKPEHVTDGDQVGFWTTTVQLCFTLGR